MDRVRPILNDIEDLCARMLRAENHMGVVRHIPNLKTAINKFFNDGKCLDIIYTDNTDKLFFGMVVMPILNDDEVETIVLTEDPLRIQKYYLEMDSKLFSKQLRLNARELTAIILHEIGHMVNNPAPVEDVRKNIDTYLMTNNIHLPVTKNKQYLALLSFGIKDSLRKLTSIFEKKNNIEIMADELAIAYGYQDALESAMNKILKCSFSLNKHIDNKFLVFAWVIRLYCDVRHNRIPALRTLKSGKQLIGSKLYSKEFTVLINSLKRIDDDSILESHFKDRVARMKYKCIRDYENDFYEYTMRVRNTDIQDDAILILHKINSRMAIIDDYIMTEDIKESEKKKWMKLYNKYELLREELSKKMTYKDNYYRINIDYPSGL